MLERLGLFCLVVAMVVFIGMMLCGMFLSLYYYTDTARIEYGMAVGFFGAILGLIGTQTL